MRQTSFALIIALALMCCFTARASIRPGDTPPDALGTTADGQVLSLASLHGKVVVISFWATWCGYCLGEIPVLAKLQLIATARKLPLQVVTINYRENRDTFRNTARVLHERMPNLLISWDRYGRIGKPYGTDAGIPVMVMVHRDGTVAHIHAGYGPDMLNSLIAEINTMLSEPAPTSKVLAAH